MAHLRQGLRSRILLCLAPVRRTAAVGLDEAEVEGTSVGEEGLFTTTTATDTMIRGIVHQTVLTGHVAGHRCVEIETCETTGILTEGTVMIAGFPGSTTLTSDPPVLPNLDRERRILIAAPVLLICGTCPERRQDQPHTLCTMRRRLTV